MGNVVAIDVPVVFAIMMLLIITSLLNISADANSPIPKLLPSPPAYL